MVSAKPVRSQFARASLRSLPSRKGTPKTWSAPRRVMQRSGKTHCRQNTSP